MRRIFTNRIIGAKCCGLTLLLTFMLTASFAQNRSTFLQESFDGTSVPEGWRVVGLGTSNWSLSATNNAGGSANEVMLYYNPSFNGTSRLCTPAIDLTGKTSVLFSFKHALDIYGSSHKLEIATSSDGGTTWNSGWEQNYSASGVYSVSQSISTSDIGNDSVIFAICYTGYSYNINNWYFDDVEIFTLEDADAAMGVINVNPMYSPSAQIPVAFNLINRGNSTITSAEVSYQFTGQDVVTETFSDLNIASVNGQELTFTETANLEPGEYTLTVSISKINGVDDAFADNNSKSMTVAVATQTVQRTVMIEHFSSSTCGSCVPANQQMLTLLNNNPGKYCIVKYQMNWPGNGDPYYTVEGGVRRMYYGISSVPAIMWEGGKYQGSPSQAALNTLYADSAYLDIRGKYWFDGDKVKIDFDVIPYLNASGVRILIAISEKTTTGNTGSNGETSFHHIMMKMVPDAYGIDTVLVLGETQSYTFSQDMSETNVEEISDLEVAVFVQKVDSKYIFNSKFLDCACPSPINVAVSSNIVSIDDMSADITWDLPSDSLVSSFNIFLNDALIGNTEDTTYTYDLTFGQHCFTIQSLCADNTTSANSAPECTTISCGAPTGLTSTVNDSDVTLNWKGGIISSSYDIYRDGEIIATEVIDTFYVDQNLEAGAYTYKVKALCGSEPSSFSGNVIAKVGCLAPTNLEANATTANKIKVKWTASPTAVAYNVYSADTLVAEGITTNTYTVTGLSAGTYCFTVKSVCEGDVLSDATEEACETLTGIEDIIASTKMYPNPANTQLNIEGNEINRISVFDMMGRIVEDKNFNNVSSCVFETSKYQRGIYLFNVEFADGRKLSQRVVIAH